MHFGLRQIALIVFFCALSPGVWAQAEGGFNDFNEEIILKDKKNDNSDLDFMENGKEQQNVPKKPKSVDDENVLENLEKEVEKSNAGEKKDAKKADEAPQKRTLKQKEDESPAAATENADDELLLKEEEEEQAEIEADESPKAAEKPKAPDDLEGVDQDKDLKAIEDQESEMESGEKTTETPTQPTTEEATEESIVERPQSAPMRQSRKWARPGNRVVLPREDQDDSEPYSVGVDIDPDYYTGKVVKKCNCKYDALVPYSLRRESWSTTFGLGMNTYNPSNFDPDAFTDTFETVYGAAETPMIELNLGLKKNFDFGAIAIDGGVAYYSNTGSTSDTTLTMKFVSLAANIYLDNLFSEPYVVPYATAGIAEVFYDEVLEGNEAGGGSSSVYFGGGVLFQLDWMDEQANIDSYEDFGLENTFLFFEGRVYTDLKVSLGDDPNPADLSSEDIALLAGLKFEF